MTRGKLQLLTGLAAVMGLSLGCSPPQQAKPSLTAAPAVTPAPSSSTPAAPSLTPKPAAEQPRNGGKLIISVSADPATFDLLRESSLAAGQISVPCYNGLVQYDPLAWPEYKAAPGLAQGWELSPDGLQYTFRLNKGVNFHDGKPFTAQDAKFSLDRIYNPPRGAISIMKGSFQAIKEVKAPDDQTLVVTSSQPFPSLIPLLAYEYMVMVPKHVVEEKGSMERTIIGTGPYKFKNLTRGVSWELEKNPDYFVKGRPYLDGIKAYMIKDPGARQAAFATGQISFITPLPVPTAQEATFIKRYLGEKVVIKEVAHVGIQGVTINMQRPPWNDARVRKALSLAIDRQKALQLSAQGDGVVGAFMHPQGQWTIPRQELLSMPGYRQPKDADVAEAGKLLSEVTIPRNFRTVAITQTQQQRVNLAVYIKDELGKLGIDLSLQVLEDTAFYDAQNRKDFNLVVGILPGVPVDDPDLAFGQTYISGAGRNYGLYSNPRFDELFVKQSTTVDVAERKRTVREMQMILFEDNPLIPIYWPIYRSIYRSSLRNWVPSLGTVNSLRFQEVWLAE
ncbi:MAG: hypothetical protein HYX92_15290 [Chloroflexi bacterium]|nr:hypothetical protein [Chloroflexota bacterium]